MKAEEARRIVNEALRSQEGEVGKRLEAVYQKIKKSAIDGESSLDASAEVRELNTDQCRAFIARLREQGYAVKEGSDVREGSWCTISWNT